LKTYSQAYRNRLADEVAAAPSGAAWPQAITDYVALRDAVRACKSPYGAVAAIGPFSELTNKGT
jgi:hypothetical protein